MVATVGLGVVDRFSVTGPMQFVVICLLNDLFLAKVISVSVS
jgi:hypothetical protein